MSSPQNAGPIRPTRPSWYENIETVEFETPPPFAVRSCVAFVARFLHRRLAYTYEVIELVASERLVMRTAEAPFPMETTWMWAPAGEGATRMTLRNRGRAGGFLQTRGAVHGHRVYAARIAATSAG